MRIAILTIFVMACTSSSGPSGDPQNGDATIVIGGTTGKLVVGSAIADASMPGNMIVQLGTSGVTCTTDLNSSESPLQGQFAYFSVSSSGPGVYSEVQIGLISDRGNSVAFDEGTGSVEIDSIDTRVTGQVTYTPGGNAANGTFDVEKCF